MKKTCIIIVGPTAVGKTSLAIQIAQHFNTQIISADSRQCFTELNIGVAKPTSQDLQLIKHYFINSHSIVDDVNAAIFEQYALDSVARIFEKHDIAVMVGGTGLYIKAFCNGIDEMPAINPLVRKKIIADFEQKGLEWLQSEIQYNDPIYFNKGEMKNPNRLIRALEIKISTGKSIAEFHTHFKKQRNFNIVKIGLELPKEQLHKNINNRVDVMMNEGLLEEVKTLKAFKAFNALQTVGYKELFEYLNNEIELGKAIEAIKKNTRQYAKRQLTWFKKDNEIKWIPSIQPAIELVEESFRNK